jgi:hypothetical protein
MLLAEGTATDAAHALLASTLAYLARIQDRGALT